MSFILLPRVCQIEPVGAHTLKDNQVTPETIFSYDPCNANFSKYCYSIKRDGNKYEYGEFVIVCDGSTLEFSILDQVVIHATGITLSADIVGGVVVVQYISTDTTYTSSFKYNLVSSWGC